MQFFFTIPSRHHAAPAINQTESSFGVSAPWRMITSQDTVLTSVKKHLDLPYWIHVGTTADTKPLTPAEMDALAHALICHGFRAARLERYGQPAEARFDYLNPDKT